MRALITGGSSGIGLEYARQLAEKGYDLMLVSNRSEDLERAEQTLSSAYRVHVLTRCQDLALPGAAEELHGWCAGQGISPDVLINNAGMFFWTELDPSDMPRVSAMLNLHIVTPTRLCLLFGAEMKARGSGYILNMSSMAARLPVPGITVYSATKAYLKSFSKSLYYEMRPCGVGVTAVCPAAVATPLYRLDPGLMRLGVRLGFIHTPRWLVKRALRGLFRRRRVVSPSFMNVYLPPLVAALPGGAVDRIWKRFR